LLLSFFSQKRKEFRKRRGKIPAPSHSHFPSKAGKGNEKKKEKKQKERKKRRKRRFYSSGIRKLMEDKMHLSTKTGHEKTKIGQSKGVFIPRST
jgi:hypothetical protein